MLCFHILKKDLDGLWEWRYKYLDSPQLIQEVRSELRFIYSFTTKVDLIVAIDEENWHYIVHEISDSLEILRMTVYIHVTKLTYVNRSDKWLFEINLSTFTCDLLYQHNSQPYLKGLITRLAAIPDLRSKSILTYICYFSKMKRLIWRDTIAN